MFKRGDAVWVPCAGYESIWLPYQTTINSQVDALKYRVYLPIKRLSMSEPYHLEEFTVREKEIFRDMESCAEYIRNYYYDGLCQGCDYLDKSGYIWGCKSCEHAKLAKGKNFSLHIEYTCELNGLVVVDGLLTRNMECCSKFSPQYEKDKPAFISWENYEDVLRNCEFNQDCPHHKKSAHYTCSYERYLNQLIQVDMRFEYNGRTVKYVLVPRKMWLDQTFKNGNLVKCRGLIFEPLLTATGRLKKNAVNFEAFDEITEIDTRRDYEAAR